MGSARRRAQEPQNRHFPPPGAAAPPQVDDASYPGPEDVGHLGNFQFVQTAVAPRRFGDDLVGTHTVHQVVKTFWTPPQIALDPLEVRADRIARNI